MMVLRTTGMKTFIGLSDEPAAVAAVPWQNVTAELKKLLERGYQPAVCEQVDHNNPIEQAWKYDPFGRCPAGRKGRE